MTWWFRSSLCALFALGLVASAAPASAQSCDPAPGARRGRVVQRLRSAELTDVRRALAPLLARAQAAAPGIRRWDAHSGAEGSTYATRSYRLGPEGCGAELEGMGRRMLRPDPDDFVFYSEARPLVYVEAPKIDASFDADRRTSEAETSAVGLLAKEIETLVSARPDLVVFIVAAGWADAVGARHAGVAIVDPRTREAVWIYGQAQWSA